MKKLLLLSILLFTIFSCNKDDEQITEEPTPVNLVNGIIEVIDGINVNSVIIQNGSLKKNITDENFEIDALTDISSAQDTEGNIIYLHSKYLSPTTFQSRTTNSSNNNVSILLTPEETARSLIFNSLGLQYISNDTKFYENVGKVIELDGALAPLFNQLVTVIENDIATNGKLTNLTYQSNILTNYNDTFSSVLDLSSTILDWPNQIFDLLEPTEQEYNVDADPYFIINDNGTPKRSNKIASFVGGCVVEIKNSTKLSNGTWDLNLDFYNKFPSVRYVTEMHFDSNGERVYSKNTLDNIIKPYNSSEFYNDITSLATIKDLFDDYVDIAANGILASDWQTTQSTKNEIELNVSTSENYLLVGNVWENNDLLFYSMVDIMGKTMGLLNTIDKIGVENEDDNSKKDLLKKFVEYLKDPNNQVGVKITQNIQLIVNNSGDLNALNEHIKVLAIDLSTEFLEWISSQAGKAALETYIDKKQEILIGENKINQLQFVEEVFTVVKDQDITLDNAINVLSDKFPFFKAVQTGLKIGTVVQDIAIFFFNMKNPVLHRQIYLPFESEIYPDNNATVDIGTEFSINFATDINLTSDTSKKIEIVETNTNTVIQEIELSQLSIDNTGKKLLFSPNGLSINTQYYILIPQGLVFNNSGDTFQGIHAYDIWSFTTSTVTNENIYDGDVTLTTQQEVDDFGANSYTEITGNLLIEGNNSNNITDLNNLNTINTIGGYFVISNNPNIINLDGLNSITSIGSYLYIWNNETLNSIESLNGITTIEGALSINNNNLLSTLNGLQNLTLVESLRISDNDNLTSLNALQNITNITNVININRNDSLTSLNGLQNIVSVGDDLWVFFNDNLTSLNGLNNITSIGGKLEISSSPSLTTLNGLENVTSVGGSLIIAFNDNINSLNSLTNVTTVGGNLWITDNDNLTNLNGLESISNLAGSLNIGYNWNSTTQEDGNLNLTNLCAIKQLIINGQVSSSEYTVVYNAYNPSYTEIQNTGSGGCEQ